MNNIIDNLGKKQNIYIYLLAATLFFISGMTFFIYPVFTENEKINNQVALQNSLQQYLLSSQEKIENQKIFATLTSRFARNIINRNFSSIERSLVIDNNTIVLTATKQNFMKIIQSIQKVKSKHGIVVIKANINKVAPGLVDATLTFKYP